MPQEVTLSLEAGPREDAADQSEPDDGPLTTTVIAEAVTLTDELARLEGLDPAHYPRPIREHISFYSHNLTALIPPESPVTIDKVTRTEDPVPEAIPE